MKLFCVFDSAAEAYGLPFCLKSTGEAIRDFATASKDPQTKIQKHPADFTLFEIGEYNELTGEITQLQAHKNLGKALEYQQASL